MDETVESYEQEKAAYLYSRRAVDAVHVSKMKKVRDDYLAAVEKLIDEYQADLARLDKVWREVCSVKGWQP